MNSLNYEYCCHIEGNWPLSHTKTVSAKHTGCITYSKAGHIKVAFHSYDTTQDRLSITKIGSQLLSSVVYRTAFHHVFFTKILNKKYF